MQSRDQAQAGNRTFKLTGMTHAQVTDFMRDMGRQVAEEVTKHNIAIPSKKHRPDVGYCQIDLGVVRERVSQPEPIVQVAFDIEGDMGVTLKLKLMDFLEDPENYLRDIFQQLGPMRRNVARRRRHTQDANAAIYRAITEGRFHG